MNFAKFHFGAIEIDGVIYERDVVIDGDRIRKRKKKPSKKFREVLDIPRSRSRKRYPGNANAS
jgi:hypothetical protein